MKHEIKKVTPMRWPVISATYKPRTTPDGLPIIGARDDAHEVLRHILPFILGPNIVAMLSVDAGLQLDGEECLKFSQKIADNYARTVDAMCGGPGRYGIPDALLVDDGSSERAEFVAMLDEMLALLRSDKGVRNV